jgi:membrane associated rhomboid family serine protease
VLIPYNADVPMERLPFANWVLIAVTCLVSISVWMNEAKKEKRQERELNQEVMRLYDQLEQTQDPRARDDLHRRIAKLMPDDDEDDVHPFALNPGRFRPWQLVTSLFVHADIFHLVGNMIFLFCFGNAVNAKLGHGLFLGSYALLGVIEGLGWLVVGNGHPTIGASGAIMGIVGIFLVLFPKNDVSVLYWFGIYWAGEFSISSYVIIMFYMAGDLIGTVFFGNGGVAYACHLIGAVAGVGLGILLVWTRVLRSERYEQNLLEMFGWQPPKRKKKKKKRRVKEMESEG